MQQIADRIGMHVTTVSRAVDDKWLQTPRGPAPLRKFFVGGTVSADGEEVAWDTVRIKLQEIVDGEPKDAPSATTTSSRNWGSGESPWPAAR